MIANTRKEPPILSSDLSLLFDEELGDERTIFFGVLQEVELGLS